MANNTVSIMNEYKKNIKFIAYPVWINWGQKEDGEILKKQFCVIGIRDEKSNLEVIHPISDFILSKYGMRSYNTQRKRVNNVVKFLNYIVENKNRLEVKSLSDITLSTGVNFLNSLFSSEDTVREIERTLTQFYIYLSQTGCITQIPDSAFKKKENFRGDFYYTSPFKGVIYPSRKLSKVEHTFPEKYIPLLFEIGIIKANPIVLGLYLQLFGGLRVGEIVNLKRAGLKRKVKSGDILARIENQLMRTDIKDSSGSSSVKVPRKQRIFQIKGWYDILYGDHIALYKDKDGSGALFVNRDGKAMSGKSYRQYFDKLKNHFIDYLRNNGDAQDRILAQHLKIVKWSTHIGRGTFTNLVASESDNPMYIAFSRGDKDLMSALIYMAKTERMRKNIEKKFEEMHQYYIPRLLEEE